MKHVTKSEPAPSQVVRISASIPVTVDARLKAARAKFRLRGMSINVSGIVTDALEKFLAKLERDK